MITFFLLRPLKMQWNVCFEEKYWSLGRLISSAYLRSTNTAAGKYNKYSWQPFSHLSADGQLFLSANFLSFRCQKMRKGCVSLSSTWSVQRRAVPNCPFWQSMATFCTHFGSTLNSISAQKKAKKESDCLETFNQTRLVYPYVWSYSNIRKYAHPSFLP